MFMYSRISKISYLNRILGGVCFSILLNLGGVMPAWAGLAPAPPDDDLTHWCTELQKSVDQLKWKVDVCKDLPWKIGGKSVQGRPLVYAEFGEESPENTNLVISMVHGDEITPLYLALKLARWAQEHPGELKKMRVVIAPLVNPDGFFATPRTRVNARGVDVNRNFATKDWNATALALWKSRFRAHPRRFPGKAPRSEPETLFQEEMIYRYQAQKILAIHSPLNHTDYDGPGTVSLAQFSNDYTKASLELRKKMKAKSAGFFPGSLGNYAGNERRSNVFTLELPTTNSAKAEAYWQKFLPGIQTMIQFKLPRYISSLPPRVGG